MSNEMIEVGSCPTCGGPAQFIIGGEVRHIDMREAPLPKDGPPLVVQGMAGWIWRDPIEGTNEWKFSPVPPLRGCEIRRVYYAAPAKEQP